MATTTYREAIRAALREALLADQRVFLMGEDVGRYGGTYAVSKGLLLVVALCAAYVTSLKPGDILFLVGAAFSLAASGFFPALVMGIFWKRTTGIAASLGMVAGFGVTFYYMITTQPWLREMFLGIPRSAPATLWWDIQPISAGLFGVPLGFLVIIVVSMLTPAPDQATQDLVDHVRYPNMKEGAASGAY